MSESYHWENLRWCDMTDDDRRALVRVYGERNPDEYDYMRKVFDVAQILYGYGFPRGVDAAEKIIAKLGLDKRRSLEAPHETRCNSDEV